VIAVASKVEAKLITERLPWYQSITMIYDDDHNEFTDFEECALECPYVAPMEDHEFRGFITEWCPLGQMPDENLYCRTASEIDPQCDFHYRGSCIRCSNEDGTYPPHESEYYLEDEEANNYYMMGHTLFESYYTRNSLRRSCALPNCFFGSHDNTECLVCNSRETGFKLIDDFIQENWNFYYEFEQLD